MIHIIGEGETIRGCILGGFFLVGFLGRTVVVFVLGLLLPLFWLVLLYSLLLIG